MKTEAIAEIRSTHKDDMDFDVYTVVRESGTHNHPVKRQQHAMPFGIYVRYIVLLIKLYPS